MRRRQPDSIDVQQMKAHEREERLRREVGDEHSRIVQLLELLVTNICFTLD